MKVVIDTNVILDALLARTPWNRDAEEIFLSAAQGKGEFCITANTVTDIYDLVHTYLKDREQSLDTMNKLFQLFPIVNTAAEDCINALYSEVSNYEAAVLSEIAKRTEMDYIVTRNTKDFSQSCVKTVSPEEFLRIANKGTE